MALAASVSNSARSASVKPRVQAEAVGEHDRADHAVLAAQHAEHAVADLALGEIGRDPGRERVDRARRARRRPPAQRAQRGGGAGVDGRHRLARGARAEAGAQRRAAVGGEQDHLGLLGPEGLQRALEQPVERVRDLGGFRQRAVGLVEELDLLVPLALADVGAVAEEGDQDRDRQQRGGGRPLDPEDAADQRHRGARDRDHEVHAEHLADLVAGDAALGEDDRADDLSDRQHAAELRGQQHRSPGHPAEALVEVGGACTTTSSTVVTNANWATLKKNLIGGRRRSSERHERSRGSRPRTRASRWRRSAPASAGRRSARTSATQRRNSSSTGQRSVTSTISASAHHAISGAWIGS